MSGNILWCLGKMSLHPSMDEHESAPHPCLLCRLLRGEAEEEIGPEMLQQLQTRIDAYLADKRSDLGIKLDSMRVVQTGGRLVLTQIAADAACLLQMRTATCSISIKNGLRLVSRVQSLPFCAIA